LRKINLSLFCCIDEEFGGTLSRLLFLFIFCAAFALRSFGLCGRIETGLAHQIRIPLTVLILE
jgi:hypothetical protein